MTNNNENKKEGKEMGKETLEQPIMHNWVCERCNHTWLPRSEEAPETCPKCRSPYWNKPRQNSPSQTENDKV
jgi:rubrerythrin